jgi:hypothetical protein
MDPLSIVSLASTGIAATTAATQLIQSISASIEKQLAEYRKNTHTPNSRSEPKSAAELVSELHNTQLLLEQLGHLERQNGFFGKQSDNSRGSLLRILSGCQEVVDKLEKRQTSMRNMSKFKASFYSTYRQRDIDELLQTLHVRQKELQLCMTM